MEDKDSYLIHTLFVFNYELIYILVHKINYIPGTGVNILSFNFFPNSPQYYNCFQPDAITQINIL